MSSVVKLATLRIPNPQSESEKRDGQLVVQRADDALVAIPGYPNLLAAIRDWDTARLAIAAAQADPNATAVQPSGFMAPLPRTTCWIDGSAFIQHIILVRKARGADPPEDLRTVPLMYQGVSDPLLGPEDPIEVANEAYGIDMEAEVAVILDEVPMGTKAENALDHVKLLCLMNDISLRNLIPRELKAGFGFFQSKPPTAFGPFAVTPDALGDAWRDGRVHLPMMSWRNGKRHGDPDAGEMYFSFAQLIEHAARTRPLPAGTILGSGTVSNEDTARGSSCIAETRMLETIVDGSPATPFLSFGERVRIDMMRGGESVFGVIDQEVKRAEAPAGNHDA